MKRFALATVTVAASCGFQAASGFMLPTPSSHCTSRRLPVQQHHRPYHHRPYHHHFHGTTLCHSKKNIDDDQEEMQRLLQAFLRGERSSMEEEQERAKLQLEMDEENTQGLWGKAKHVFRGITSKAPLLLVAPLVLWAGIQLSGLAVALGLTTALVAASFVLPSMFASTFILPLVVLMLVGTFVFPILPFAILGFIPGFVVLPLLFLAGVYLMTQFLPSIGGGLGRQDESSFPFWGNDFQWIRFEMEEEEEKKNGRGGGRGGGGGIIDVKATVADDDEDD